jgi:hypothetical protein
MQGDLFGASEPEVQWKTGFVVKNSRTGLYVGPYEWFAATQPIEDAMPFGFREGADARRQRGPANEQIVVEVEYAIREKGAKK